MPSSTVHKILHKRIYTGQYDYKGVRFDGVHEPIVSLELWKRVPNVLAQRLQKRLKKRKHSVA